MNAPARPFVTERLGHLHNARLGRGVCRTVYGRNEAGDGCDVDDFAGSVETQELFAKFLAGDKRALEVDIEELQFSLAVMHFCHVTHDHGQLALREGCTHSIDIFIWDVLGRPATHNTGTV